MILEATLLDPVCTLKWCVWLPDSKRALRSTTTWENGCKQTSHSTGS